MKNKSPSTPADAVEVLLKYTITFVSVVDAIINLPVANNDYRGQSQF